MQYDSEGLLGMVTNYSSSFTVCPPLQYYIWAAYLQYSMMPKSLYFGIEEGIQCVKEFKRDCRPLSQQCGLNSN